MRYMNRLNKDCMGAALVSALGAVVLVLGLTYEPGTLRQMGAGFLPIVFGVLMIAVGLVIGLTAVLAQAPPVDRETPAPAGSEAQWRGWACIIGGVLAFVVFGRFGGFVPAAFLSVFVAALGDRENSVRSAAGLAAVVDVFSIAIFHYGLHVQLALFQWG